MKMKRMLIMIPDGLKTKLDRLRSRGYTASGFVRHLLEREFAEGTASSYTASKSRQKGGGH
jgi:hypothetical protein